MTLNFVFRAFFLLMHAGLEEFSFLMGNRPSQILRLKLSEVKIVHQNFSFLG